MNITVQDDGKISIPKELRDALGLNPGTVMEIQTHQGTLVLRKHQPLTAEQCAALLEHSRSLPKPAPEDDAAVEQAIREVRERRQ